MKGVPSWCVRVAANRASWSPIGASARTRLVSLQFDAGERATAVVTGAEALLALVPADLTTPRLDAEELVAALDAMIAAAADAGRDEMAAEWAVRAQTALEEGFPDRDLELPRVPEGRAVHLRQE